MVFFIEFTLSMCNLGILRAFRGKTVPCDYSILYTICEAKNGKKTVKWRIPYILTIICQKHFGLLERGALAIEAKNRAVLTFTWNPSKIKIYVDILYYASYNNRRQEVSLWMCS